MNWRSCCRRDVDLAHTYPCWSQRASVRSTGGSGGQACCPGAANEILYAHLLVFFGGGWGLVWNK